MMSFNSIVSILLSLLLVEKLSAQLVVRNDGNSNFYSVAVPSSQTMFHRYFGGVVSLVRFLVSFWHKFCIAFQDSRPNLDFQLAQRVQNQNQFLVEQNAPYQENAPQVVQRFTMPNLVQPNHLVHSQPAPQVSFLDLILIGF